MCADEGLPLEVLLHFLEPPRAQDNAVPAEYIIDTSDAREPEEPSESTPLHYEAAEHQAIAEDLKLYHLDGTKTSAHYPLITVPKGSTSISLTFGRIIALAGDFYTNREHKSNAVTGDYPPICGAFYQSPFPPTQRFENAVKSLVEDQDGFLVEITTLLNQEHKTISKARELDKSVSKTYHDGEIKNHFEPDNCKLPDDSAFFDALGGKEQITILGKDLFKVTNLFKLLYNPLLSLYAWLAYTNADHFGEDAVKAYCIGHASALRIASQARNKTNVTEKWAELKRAYIYEAFAAHYLTDLFSAGHIRSPRRFLHAPDPSLLARATIKKHPIFGGQKEVPIWDHQQRYMHDDDCATGLLVRNEEGDEWIAYGDKQFFEAKNAVNRARAARCLQVSVDEVYKRGYCEGFNPIFEDSEDSWKEWKTKFAATKLLPMPMTACLSSDWIAKFGNYDMHNPAPLWRAGAVNQFGKVPVEDWTTRKDVNDHSNFDRIGGSPSEKPGSVEGLLDVEARDECKTIRDAPFRGDDQFVAQNSMAGLMSGGFVQVQDLQGPQKGAGTCVNFWNPAQVQINGKWQETFTIRNRLIDIKTPVLDLPDSASPVHWKLRSDFGHGGRSTFLTGFYWISGYESASSEIAFYETEFVEKDPSFLTSHGVVAGGKRVGFNLSKSWNMHQLQSRLPIILSRGLPAGYNRANTTRFLMERFLPGDFRAPDVLAVTALPEYKVQIAICNPELEPSRQSPFNTILSLQSPIFGFARAAVDASKIRKNLLLVNASYEKAISTVDIYEYSFERQEGTHDPKVVDKHSHLEWKLYDDQCVGDSCVLVGDVLGQGNDQVVVVSGYFDNPETRLYSRAPGGSPPNAFAVSGCATHSIEYDMALVRPYMTALVPSISKNGLDILRISLRQEKKSGAKHLYFHTYLRSDQPAGGENTLIWDKCRESVVADPLASNKNGQYFHIKFIRTTREIKNQGEVVRLVPAILEIFSWYGVLGVRLFAAGLNGWDYEWCGQQPYLGQTSIGVGLGSDGDWADGFMAWASADQWPDINVFKPKSKENMTQGTWGMSLDDLNTQHVRGYEIEKRPPR